MTRYFTKSFVLWRHYTANPCAHIYEAMGATPETQIQVFELARLTYFLYKQHKIMPESQCSLSFCITSLAVAFLLLLYHLLGKIQFTCLRAQLDWCANQNQTFVVITFFGETYVRFSGRYFLETILILVICPFFLYMLQDGCCLQVISFFEELEPHVAYIILLIKTHVC